MSSTPILNAAADLKRFVKMLEPLSGVAAALDSIGALDNAEQELTVRVAALRDEAGAAQAEVDTARALSAQIVADANAEAEALKAAADEQIAAASASALLIESSAKTNAEAIVSSANAEAEQIRESARSVLSEAANGAEEIRQSVLELKSVRNTLNEEVQALMAKAAELKQQFAALAA